MPAGGAARDGLQDGEVEGLERVFDAPASRPGGAVVIDVPHVERHGHNQRVDDERLVLVEKVEGGGPAFEFGELGGRLGSALERRCEDGKRVGSLGFDRANEGIDKG